MSELAQRVDTFRALRAEIEAGVLPFATSHPAVMRFGARVASEGGGDVDAGWARPA